MKVTPFMFRHGINLWPPFLFSGIKLTELSNDWRHARVVLRLRPWNRNYVGSQFGGSLFSMTDPFWMLLILHQLWRDYIVWDRAAEISFEKPGRGHVSATFDVTPEIIDELRAAAAGGEKVLRWFDTDVVADDGTVVAKVRKQIYVRLKKSRRTTEDRSSDAA